MKPIIIGTRGSLLALAQCSLLKEELAQKTGRQFELKIIKTTGDQITDRPLWQLEGKDFFTKELDQALLAETVDLVVHSYKDLGSERPAELTLAAVTQRSFANDILFIRKSSKEKLQQGNFEGILRIGTSSPRRMHLLQKSLKHFLPFADRLTQKQLEIVHLRGNVNSRLEKLLLTKSEQSLDAIVVAMAGVERLCAHPESKIKLQHFWQHLDFKVLPLSIFPCAPAQGALAVECLTQREDLLQLLQKVHHLPSASAIAKERAIFQAFGGGCHLALGAYTHEDPQSNVLWQIVEGQLDGQPVENAVSIKQNAVFRKKILEVIEKSSHDKTLSFFIGLPLKKIPRALLQNKKMHLMTDQWLKKVPYHGPHPRAQKNAINEILYFVTSSYCLPNMQSQKSAEAVDSTHYWAAGPKTHQVLAQEGHWVRGDNDFFGSVFLKTVSNSALLKNFSSNNFLVITASKTEATSDIGQVWACYQTQALPIAQEELISLSKSQCFFWTSSEQFDYYRVQLLQVITLQEFEQKQHFCSFGKTFHHLKQCSINPTVIPNTETLFSLLHAL